MHVFTSVCSRYLSRFFLDNNFPAINNYLHEIWFPRSCAGLCYVLGWPNSISHPAAQFLKQLMILHLNLGDNRCIFNPIFVLLILHIPCWHWLNALNLILVNNGASQKHIFIEFVRITCSWKKNGKRKWAH